MMRGATTLDVQPSDSVATNLSGAGVLTVTINRPEKRNPLALGVLESIRASFQAHSNNEQVRVAVVTGSGNRAFASGGDLKELMVYRSREEAAAFSELGKAALNAIRSFPVPVVGKINGVALGGGAELALSCDLRFAASHARIGFIHGRLKIAPSWGGGHDLVRLVGPACATRLLCEASIIDSAEAQQASLFDAVCPPGEDFEAWFDERVALLASNPREVMRAIKAAAGRMDGRKAADERETAHFAEVWVHENHWAAVAELERQFR